MDPTIFHARIRRRQSRAGKLARIALVTGGGWIVYSDLFINHQMHLSEAVAAERKVFFSEHAGRLSYYTDRQVTSRPLVLLHSINAAASSYEMRPLFEHYRPTRPVYALDLPGYGFSDRSQRTYTPELFENAILDFINQEVKEPADVVALSLSGEFAARAAVHKPELFHSLTMISPTGLSARQMNNSTQRAGRSGMSRILYPLFSFGLWSRPFFDLLSTRASIRYFLAKSFTMQVPDSLANYAYATAHQPGAENAPLHFISGLLFSTDVCESFYKSLQTPTQIIYDHDPYTSFDLLPELLQSNKNCQATRIIPTMGMPHWEQLLQTTAALDQFWAVLA